MIYAIIWQDMKLGGMPLSLHCANGEEAIAKAQGMHAKAGDTLAGLRAVSLDPMDTLTTLWSA